MKKLTAMLLLVAMLVSMTACAGGQKNDPTTDSTVNTTEGKNDPTGDATQAPAENPTEPAKPAGLSGTMEELIGKLIEANPVQFMGGVMPIDLTDKSEEGLWRLKSFTGLDSADSITEAAAYESMIGSIAYSLVMVRTAEGKDAKTVAQTMKDNIDTRKWLCVGADQVMVAGYGDVVMFIMLFSELGLSAQAYVDTFTTMCGGKVDFVIS